MAPATTVAWLYVVPLYIIMNYCVYVPGVDQSSPHPKLICEAAYNYDRMECKTFMDAPLQVIGEIIHRLQIHGCWPCGWRARMCSVTLIIS